MRKYILFIVLLLSFIMLSSCSGIEINPQPQPNTYTDEDNKAVLDELVAPVEMHQLNVKHSDITNSDYEYLYFGYYPKRLISDKNIVDALSKIEEVNDLGYIEYVGYQFMKVKVVNNHKYADEFQKGDDVYEYGTGFKPGEVYYFLVEPICWKVLFVNGNEYFLQTESIIDAHLFTDITRTTVIDGKTINPSDYEYSIIRQWLNHDFLETAFSSLEQEMIIESLNVNEPVVNYLQNYERPNDTLDYVFLPSYQEVTNPNYGFLKQPVCDNSRYAQATDYANAHGLIKHVNEGYNTSIWAIRNNFEYVREYMAYVGYDGLAVTDFFTDAENVGIRPCMKITLED